MNKLLKKVSFFLCLFVLININIFSYTNEVIFSVDNLDNEITVFPENQSLLNFFRKKKKKKKLVQEKEKKEQSQEDLKSNNNDGHNLDLMSSVLVCDNSLESYEFILEFIKNANKAIEMSLCMTGGEVFQKIMNTVQKRMLEKEELQVFLMLEPTFLDEKDHSIISNFKEVFSNRLFISWTDFAPTNLLDANVYQRHSKFIVVDEKYFVLGGTNFEDLMCTRGDIIPEDVDSLRRHMFMNRPLAFRDQDVVCCSSKIARELRQEFHCSFKLWEHFSLTHVLVKDINYFLEDNYFFEVERNDACIVNLFHLHPDLVVIPNDCLELVTSGLDSHGGTAPITDKYIDLISKAKKEVLIANLYFVPHKSLLDILVNTAQNNIILEVIGNGLSDKSPSLVGVYCWGNRYNYTSLLFGRTFYFWEKSFAQSLNYNENVSIYEFYVDNTQLHKKIMIIDEEKLVIGSYNLCLKSHNMDQEVILVITSSEVAKKAKIIFEKDKRLSLKLTKEQILDWHFNLYCHSQGFIQTKYMPA